MRIDLEPPTPRDPFYRRPARDLSLVRRADPVRIRCETRFARSPPPLASRLCGGLRRDGSARAAAARSQARPRGVRALSLGHLRAAPRLQGARHVGSDAKEGVRAASQSLWELDHKVPLIDGGTHIFRICRRSVFRVITTRALASTASGRRESGSERAARRWATAPGRRSQLRVGLRPKLLRRRATPFGVALLARESFGQSFACGVAQSLFGALCCALRLNVDGS